MKQIVPFSKDIIFKTSVAEITAIGIEQTSEVEEDEILSGEFTLEGEYKITDASIQSEPFNYKIPFDIALDYKYMVENTSVEIEDFRYEIINNDVLRVNIDLKIEGIEEKVKKEPIIEEKKELVREAHVEEINAEEEINSVIDFNSEEIGYTTYKVHIVREGDTIEEICAQNDINKKTLEDYNEIKEIKELDKLIIPVVNNE